MERRVLLLLYSKKEVHPACGNEKPGWGVDGMPCEQLLTDVRRRRRSLYNC